MKRLLFSLLLTLSTGSLFAQSDSVGVQKPMPSIFLQFSGGQTLGSPMIWSRNFSPSFHGGLGFDLHHKFTIVLEGGYTNVVGVERNNEQDINEQWYVKGRAFIPIYQIAPDAKLWVFVGGYHTESIHTVQYSIPSSFYDPLEGSFLLEDMSLTAAIAGLALSVDLFSFLSLTLESNLLVLPTDFTTTGLEAADTPQGFIRGLGTYRAPYNLHGDMTLRFHLPLRKE
ncbi:MAG TPA: hypothetical protein DCE41_26505 [Cytophagales bacterium]|nr:hypothetical protein [Cytophagales bacterium]HAA22517.1 hypothetical protein [Cytophagales bacterium]HAP61387.1 hypothetical protein [Cytophagales bacterium]